MAGGFTEAFTRERGFLEVLAPGNPAAGANYAYVVGSLGEDSLRVISAKASLATDANVASRLFSLDYIGARSGTNIRNAATVLLTASTAATVFQWDHAHTVSEWQTGTPVFAPLADVVLVPGWSIQLTVDNKQAADAITLISIVVEKFYPDSN